MSQAGRGLLCSLVARGTTVLAESSNVSGNANVIAVRILEKLPREDTRVSYSQERHLFHVLVSDGITYLCMAEESFGRRLPFLFLEDIRARFLELYAGTCREAVAYEFNTEFASVLAQRMEFYSHDPTADTIHRVRGELSQVKDVMIENIEKVLDRGERINLLVDKTEHLQNVRMWFIIFGIVAAIVFLAVMSACGWRFHCH